MLFREQPDLLPGFRLGERKVLEQVYRRYVDELLKLAKYGFTLRGPPPVRISGIADPAARMDLVQDTFARAFAPSARQGYDGERPYRAYLFTVARNLWVDHARKQGREQPLAEPDPHGTALEDLLEQNTPLEPAVQSPEERLDAQRERQVTSDYLASLDPLARRYVALRFEGEQSLLSAARELGLSRRQARSLEERIHSGLKRRLRESTGQNLRLARTEG